jgi:cystathionine gamma-synthase
MRSTPGQRTLAVHAGERRRKSGHAVVEPIVQTATFSFETSAEVRAYQEEEFKSRFEYGPLWFTHSAGSRSEAGGSPPH